MTSHWLDRVTAPIAPRWTVKRQKARIASEFLLRHFEAASAGRRTQGWSRATGTDANSAAGAGLARLREQARDLIRNNAWARSALNTIVDHTVGWGISAAPDKKSRAAARAAEVWKSWAETTACDADGRLNVYGLEKLVIRSVARDGEVFVRRRFRRPEDGLPLPLQLQVLESDFLDTTKQGAIVDRPGNVVIQGVEFDPIGRRTAYWLFPTHPGSEQVGLTGGSGGSARPVPASEVLHIYDVERAGQVRGPSWFAPVILRLKDFDDYEDAALVKQKIAACLAVITSDIDGTSPGLGAVDAAHPDIDMLEPGMIFNAAAGRSITVVDPPVISEHAAYSATVLRAIAAGLGVSYEDMTGDYNQLPFSAARMSRLRHWARVEDWRWQMLIPQFCDPVWAWAMQSAVILGKVPEAPSVMWTAPPAPMIDPTAEGLAYARNIRSGIQTLSEAIRERGYDPDDQLAELAADKKKLEALGIILDSDASKTTQQGGPRDPARQVQAPQAPKPVSANGNGNGNGRHEDGFALLAKVRGLADEIADVVAQRLADVPPPEVPAPAPPAAQSIHVDVHTAEPERATITRKTPIRDKEGVIVEVIEERIEPAEHREPAP